VVKRVAKEELESENWLRLVARMSERTYEQMRVIVLEFLDTDVFNISAENCSAFLDPLIESWDIDFATFAMEIVLSRRLAPGNPRRFEFVEREAIPMLNEQPGFKKFLRDRSLSGDAATEELDFLKKLQFSGRQPTPLYYYRELQNLRDPLHFRAPMEQNLQEASTDQSEAEVPAPQLRLHVEVNGTAKQLRLGGRKLPAESWAKSKTNRARKLTPKS
jgi:hypothetical protein